MKRTDLSGRRLAGLVLAAGALLIVLWLGIKTWRLIQVARALPAYQESFAELTKDGLANADPEKTEALVMAVRSDVVTVRREVKPLLPLARLFSWLPRVGPLLANARPFVDLADYGSEAAAYAVRGLKPALATMQSPQPGTSTLVQLLPHVAAAKPDLAQASAAFDKAIAARARIEDVDALPSQAQTALQLLDEKLYLDGFLDLVLVLPELLGHDQPRTYLIVAQNDDEVRPTGGFISGAGILTAIHGNIEIGEFLDSYNVDARAGGLFTKPYELAPEPLLSLMGTQLLLFRDSNYWPDFPTSAAKMMELYSYGRDYPQLDGLIAIDQHFLELLLASTGPLQVEELATTVNAAGVRQAMHEAWQSQEEGETGAEWYRTRKDFLGPLASAVMGKILGDLGSLDLLYLAENMNTALTGKHMQIYSTDPAVNSVLQANDWSNHLAGKPGHDTVALIDTNVGFNKVAPYITSSLIYDVLIDDAGRGAALVTASYTHTLRDDVECRQGGQANYIDAPAYEEIARDCFWNYLRLYVPEGSELQNSTYHPYPADVFQFSEGWSGQPQVGSENEGLTLFQNFFLLEPTASLDSLYRYTLPQVTRPENGTTVYELAVLQQAGVSRDYQIKVTLPPGVTVNGIVPQPVSQSGTTIVFAGELSRDLHIRIDYTEP
jgi:hypothetical protein